MDTMQKYLTEQKFKKWEETRRFLANIIGWAESQLDIIDPEGNSKEWIAAGKIVRQIDKGFDSALANIIKLERML